MNFNNPTLIGLAAAIALVGCEPIDEETADGIVPKLLVSATQAFTTSDVVIIGDTDTKTNAVAQGDLATTNPSDISVEAFGESFFRIGRFGSDNITRYSWNVTNSEATIDWQYSVLGDDSSANPYGIGFVSETQAYVPRYDAIDLWVINPSAAVESDFLSEEIDLSAYINNSADGVNMVWVNGDNGWEQVAQDVAQTTPNAVDVLVADSKAFVLLQRLDVNFDATEASYLVVLDTSDNSFIDANGAAEGVHIDLGINNAQEMLLTDDGKLIVLGHGDIYNPGNGFEFTGGIVSVDTRSYVVDPLIDDFENQTYDFITSMAYDNTNDTIYYVSADIDGYDTSNMTLTQYDTETEVSTALSGIPTYDDISSLAVLDDVLYIGVKSDDVYGSGVAPFDIASQEVGTYIDTNFGVTQLKTFD